jgi:hypothetical protein
MADREIADEKARNQRVEALRPLLTVMEQTEARYPQLRMRFMDYFKTSNPPQFDTGTRTTVMVKYDHGHSFSLEEQGFSNRRKCLAAAHNPEDLIPPLLEGLVKAVEYIHPSR